MPPLCLPMPLFLKAFRRSNHAGAIESDAEIAKCLRMPSFSKAFGRHNRMHTNEAIDFHCIECIQMHKKMASKIMESKPSRSHSRRSHRELLQKWLKMASYAFNN